MRADFRVGDWVIRPRNDCIESGDEIVHIHPRPMAVLECLAAANGKVVTRSELFDAVWPGAIVTDDALTQCIVELRKAFGDDARTPRIIKTIPKVGFCLIPPVSLQTSETEPHNDIVAPKANKAAKPVAWIIVVAAVLCVVAVAINTYQDKPGRNDGVSGRTELAIAVLPFQDMSEGRDQEWFADGLSEELINLLARVDGLSVTSRTASFYFRGAIEDLDTITETLGVTHILEGSVRVEGKQLRVSAQLIDASSGFHLWSGTYDQQLEDVFSVQQVISQSVVQALKKNAGLPLGPLPPSDVSVNKEAYYAVLLGRYLKAERTVSALRGAVQSFEKAIEIEPDYALAHAELAMAIRLLWYNERNLARTEAQALAAPHAERALALDPGLAEAWAAAAWTAETWEESLNSYQHAIRINPSYSIAYTWMARTLRSFGRDAEVFKSLQTAVKLDPLSIPALSNYFVELVARNRLDDAAREVEKLRLLRPAIYSVFKGALASSGGKYAAQVFGALDGLLIEPELHTPRAVLARHFAMLGLEQEALAIHNSPGSRVLLILGKAEDAVKLQEKRLLKNPDYGFVQRNMGLVLASKGDYARARPFLENTWLLNGEQVSMSSVFRVQEATALTKIRRVAGEEEAAGELLAAMEEYAQRLKEMGITGTNIHFSVDYLEGITAFLSGQRETGLSMIAKAVEQGAFILPAEDYLRDLYNDPGFAPILAVQQARVNRERTRFLNVVCADNPYNEVWKPAKGTCEMFRTAR